MKNLLPVLLIVWALSTGACVTTKTNTNEEKSMKIENDKVLVIKSNGEKIVGQKFSKSGSLNIGGHWVAIDGVKYPLSDLIAYQDTKDYYVPFGDIWVRQLRRGKINLFTYETTIYGHPANGSGMDNLNSYSTHFVFQKGDGKLWELSIEAIGDLLKDNQKAYDEFKAQFRPGIIAFPKQLQNNSKVLFEVIDIYNGDR